MNKKEEYDKKIEIIKKILEADGNVETLVKIQSDNDHANKMLESVVQQLESGNENK